MRELKFRGWCKGYYKYDIVVIDETNFLDCSGWRFKGEVEQYIGLKDKNGKEIYEGDILKCSDTTRQVYYSEEYASFVFVNNSIEDELSKELFYSANSEYEVIGNVHENKELLGE